LGNSQSQEFIGRYHFNGAIYVINIDSFQKKKALIFRDETFAYIMQNSDSIDIDNYLDFKLAEIIMVDQI
jgi:CMP-N-acetylneuraminic acid synthetase